MANRLFIYWGSGSIPSWKCLIALEEKKLQGYASKLLSFDKNEQKSEEVLKLNPRGEVPTFKDGDAVICESTAVCEYLEYKFESQGTQLLPKDLTKRAAVLQRTHEVQNFFRILIEDIVYYQMSAKPEDITEDILEEKRKKGRVEIQRWENYLKAQGDDSYIVGNEFSMADVFFFPCIAFASRVELSLSPYPCLEAYYKRLEQRPSVQATWPPHWKEGPPSKGYFKGF